MCQTKNAVVLIIDDCQDNLFLMELILIEAGYEVEKASSGREGIVKIHKFVPDLIILDLMMPDMTGLEAIEHIQPHGHLASIPILLCTANRFIHQEDVVKADKICYKPIDINQMLNQVHTLITCSHKLKN